MEIKRMKKGQNLKKIKTAKRKEIVIYSKLRLKKKEKLGDSSQLYEVVLRMEFMMRVVPVFPDS